MDIRDWEKELYDATFDETFDSVVAAYEEGRLTKAEIERNIQEQKQTLMNGFYEGAKTFNSVSALIDAYELALASINKKKL